MLNILSFIILSDISDHLQQLHHQLGNSLLQVFSVQQTLTINLYPHTFTHHKFSARIQFLNLPPVLSCFSNQLELLALLKNPKNFEYDQSNKILVLKWEINGHEYNKNIGYDLKLEEQALDRIDRINIENYRLKKRLEKYEEMNNVPRENKEPIIFSAHVQESQKPDESRQAAILQESVNKESKRTRRKRGHKTKPIHKPVKPNKSNQPILKSQQPIVIVKSQKPQQQVALPEVKIQPAFSGNIKVRNNQMKYKKIILSNQNNGSDSEVKLEFENGDVYEGNMNNDGINGFGIYRTQSGSYYQGNWLNGKAHGQGKCIDTLNNKYVGQFQNDKRHGYGVEEYWNEQKYEGQYKNDMKEGKGIYWFINGDFYDGQWKEDKCSGLGKQHYVDGTIYQGMWIQDEKHGFGVIKNQKKEILRRVYFKMGKYICEAKDCLKYI